MHCLRVVMRGRCKELMILGGAGGVQGEEEQKYLEQHPELACVPAEHRLYIICRQWRNGNKAYTFWVQHRQVLQVHVCGCCCAG